jgi:ribonuclease-3
MKRILKIRKSPTDPDGDFYFKMKSILGFKPRNLSYYKKAFIHSSLNLKDEEGKAVNYERLEFLGDSVLGTIISNYLFEQAPEGNEGYLTKMRSKIVSREHLNELGKELNLISFFQSKTQYSSFGENIHGNLFEAFIGAIFMDRGFSYCHRFVQRQIIDPYVDIDRLEGKIISYKSLLIEWCQKQKKKFKYTSFEDTGNEDIKHFGVKLYIENKIVAKSRATSKKKAEEIASKRAYFALQNQIEAS